MPDVFISYKCVVDQEPAAALQRGLERLVRRWYRPRALTVFRDLTDLPAGADLPGQIEKALDESRFLVVVASPAAAESYWVSMELERWLAHHPPETVLIALADGELAWDKSAVDFDWAKTTAIPRTLQGVFAREPRWVDIRRSHVDVLRLRDPLFKDAVASLAARIHGIEKREIIRVDTRQHQYVMAALVLLLVAALTAATVAFAQREIAIAQRDVANARKTVTEAEAELAGLHGNRAHNAVRKLLLVNQLRPEEAEGAMLNASADLLGVRKIFPSSILAAVPIPGSDDIAMAIDKRVEVWNTKTWTRAGRVVDIGSPITGLAVSADGSRLATTTDDNKVRVWDVATRRLRAESESLGKALASVVFVADGSQVIAGGSGEQLYFLYVPSVDTVSPRLTEARAPVPLPNSANIASLDVSRDGRVVAGTWSGLIWLARLGDVDATLRVNGHRATGPVDAVKFNTDGTRVYSGGAEQVVRAWSVGPGPDGADVLREEQYGRGHYGPIYSLQVDREASGRERVVSGGHDGSVRVWDGATMLPLGPAMAGHKGRSAAVFSSTGHVVSTGYDGTLRLWNKDNTPYEAVLKRAGNEVFGVALSPDSARIALGGWDGHVRISTTADAKPAVPKRAPREHHNGAILGLAYSPSGTRVVSGGADGKLRMWDGVTADALRILETSGAPIRTVAFLDENRVVIGTEAGRIEIWDIALGGLVTARDASTTPVTSIAVDPRGRTLVSGSADGTFAVWDTNDLGQTVAPRRADPAAVFGVTISDDGKIATAGADGVVRLWSVSGGEPVKTMSGHAGEVLAVRFSADGQHIYSGGADSTIVLWDVQSGKQDGGAFGHLGPVRSIAVAGDGRIATAHDGVAHLWNTAGRREIAQVFGVANRVWSLAFEPGGDRVASGGEDAVVRIWRADRIEGDGGTCPIDWGAAAPQSDCPITLVGHSATIFSVAYSRDGRYLASASADCTVLIWDTASTYANKQPIAKLPVCTDHPADNNDHNVTSVAFDETGDRLVVGTFDGNVSLWSRSGQRITPDIDVDTGSKPQSPNGSVYVAGFLTDNRRVFAGGLDGTLRLWDPETGDVRVALPGGQSPISAAAHSSSSDLMAVGYENGELVLGPIDGRAPERIRAHGNLPITKVSFAAQGRYLISTGQDGKAVIWKTNGAGKLQQVGRVLDGSSLQAQSLAVDDKGGIVVGYRDGVIRVWPSPNSVKARLCQLLVDVRDSADFWTTDTTSLPEPEQAPCPITS
ncbi:TIR domain-containing protein [Nocardia colli]|uniref:TIR domain-containing protein n=1 Tax=Nocardia colli TaxID=2545717 RepID=A0A5N0ELN6_9NOCA|nr:TIR domain-containing protein [Nocardia colli]KAA8889194.1 TIR domain-containing protein [Nocardia colli]